MRRRPSLLFVLSSASFVAAGCGPIGPVEGTGGSASIATGGSSSGGSLGTGGGLIGTGGILGVGGGIPTTGGQSSTGGQNATGGFGTGGASTGGQPATGGASTGGASTGGQPATGGASTGGASTGGQPATGGASTGGAGTGGVPAEIDCDAQMPTSGAQHHSSNGIGGQGNQAWEIWSNTGTGELTTYGTTAFSAVWSEDGGYLGRMGYEWGNGAGQHESYGTISAQFVANKTGGGGNYSYIGVYGWTNSPCVEWYIVEDILPHQFNMMPINPGSTTREDSGGQTGVPLDGGHYYVYSRPTQGTGGSRCSGVNSWIQYYSVRTTPRDCGTISISEHFLLWESLGLEMGNLLEAKLIAEVGGGTGRVDFPIANVTATNP